LIKRRFSKLLTRKAINSGHYGIETIVKEYCGNKKDKHVIGIWQHGVLFVEHVVHPFQLTSHEIPKLLSKYYPFFVANEDLKEFLILRGYKNVHAIGLPIIYTNNSFVKRVNKSILLLPHHGVNLDEEIWKNLNKKPDYTEYFMFAKSISKDFEHMTLSLHRNDYTQENIALFSEIKNLKIVSGGDPNDQNSLNRMASLFRSHEYATSNVVQSALVYAGYFGCKISISGPPSLNYTFETLTWLKGMSGGEDLIPKIIFGVEFVENKCNFLRIPPSKLLDSQTHENWSSKLLGSNNKRSPKDLGKILGLSGLNLLRKYALHSITRVNQFFQKIPNL
jgi:hypothetical protein